MTGTNNILFCSGRHLILNAQLEKHEARASPQFLGPPARHSFEATWCKEARGGDGGWTGSGKWPDVKPVVAIHCSGNRPPCLATALIWSVHGHRETLGCGAAFGRRFHRIGRVSPAWGPIFKVLNTNSFRKLQNTTHLRIKCKMSKAECPRTEKKF